MKLKSETWRDREKEREKSAIRQGFLKNVIERQRCDRERMKSREREKDGDIEGERETKMEI